MPTPENPADTLDPRKAAILEAIVSEYIGTAVPVGSQHVIQAAGINVSSATVRSEMAALEHEGFLVQPHTSAGRIPTDKGYRFFVDHLTGSEQLAPGQSRKVKQFFDQVHGEMEEMLHRASGLLSELTRCTAVVVGPGHQSATIRSLQLVAIGPRVAVLVVVLSDGAVEKRTIEFDREVTEEQLAEVGQALAAHWHGRSLADGGTATPALAPALAPVAAQVGQVLASMATGEEGEQVFVGGGSLMANAFDAMETVRQVLSIIEQQLVVVSLLRDVLDRGLSVAIGTEHGFEPLASCAVVVSPVLVDGTHVGAVGLLGPTRMDYPRALAAAHVIGAGLGERLAGSAPAATATPTAQAADRKSGRRPPSERPKGVPVPGVEGLNDLYGLLEVGQNASDDEIKSAYRKKARELHPDANPGDAEAEARFKEVSFAYEVLRDPERRARYDRFGPDAIFGQGGADAGMGGFSFDGSLGDLFEAFFGSMGGGAGGGRRRGPAAGADAEVTLQLSFSESVFGSRKELPIRLPVRCDTCDGRGAAPGTDPVTCADCQGTAEIRRIRQSLLGQVVTAVACSRCQGMGEVIPSPCTDCRGEGRRMEDRAFAVEVPAGVEHGSTLRLADRGPAGHRGGPNGSLFVHLAVEPDPRFERLGDDLHTTVHVSMTQAALGARVEVSTLEDPAAVGVHPGTQSGHVERVKGSGVPHLRGRGRGDLFVHLVVDTPTELDPKQAELLRQLATERGEDVGAPPGGDGVLSRLRSAFG